MSWKFPRLALAATALVVASAGCGMQAWVRPQGLPRCDHLALASITVSRQASAYEASPLYPLSSTVPIANVDQIPVMFRRMLERAGPFQFLPEAEQIAYPGFQEIAKEYSAHAAFAGDGDLYVPPGYPLLTDEPRRSLAQAIAVSTGAASVIWGRVRFDLRPVAGYFPAGGATVYAAVDVALYDRDGDLAWHDSTGAVGGYAPSTGGFLGPTPISRGAEEGFVSAMTTLLDRLKARTNETAGRRAP